MGEVWAARNERTQRDVAIKFLLPALAGNEDAMRRFVLEARATGRLRHPGIVDLFDAGESDGRLYLVMELLVGESLEERLLRAGPLRPEQACVLFAQVARALHYAHESGVIHRDLSSANVFLTRMPDGGPPLPKILDFGVSKVELSEVRGRVRTSSGAVLGSPAYMSPEQAQGAERVDARSDVWALGVLLFESLGGRPPFSGRNYNALMAAILTEPAPALRSLAPSVPARLASLVDGCLRKAPHERPPSAGRVADELEALALEWMGRAGSGAALRRRMSDRQRWTAGSKGPEPRARGRAGWTVAGSALGVTVGLALGVAVAPRPEVGRVASVQAALTHLDPSFSVVASPPTASAPMSAPARPPLSRPRARPAPAPVRPRSPAEVVEPLPPRVVAMRRNPY